MKKSNLLCVLGNAAGDKSGFAATPGPDSEAGFEKRQGYSATSGDTLTKIPYFSSVAGVRYTAREDSE
jgi:hypothetical protein